MKAHASLIKSAAILYDALSYSRNSNGNERANSIATIKESVSAIEAFTNELGELGYGYESNGKPETDIIVRLGRELRNSEKNRKSIKQKIQVACEVLSGKKLAKGSLPTYQKFSFIVDIRNELAHPKASVITIHNRTLLPPKSEQRMIKRLRSYGFSCSKENSHDWTDSISNYKFSTWAHLAIVEMMIYVIYLWPHQNAIEGFLELYGLKEYINGPKA